MAGTNKSLGHLCPFQASIRGQLLATVLDRFGGRVGQHSHCLPLFTLVFPPGTEPRPTQPDDCQTVLCFFVLHFSNLHECISLPTEFLHKHVSSFSSFPLYLFLCFVDLDTPVLTVHQTISDVRGSYYQEKTVFLRCTVNSNPPARFIWKRGNMLIEQSKDNGVDIYEPLYTQVHTYKTAHCTRLFARYRAQRQAEKGMCSLTSRHYIDVSCLQCRTVK